MPIEMVISHLSRVLLTVLILCIGLGSPFSFQGAGMIAEGTDFDSDQTEFEEDAFFAGENSAFTSETRLGIETGRLNVDPASLTPAFQPPRYSNN